MYPQMNRIPKSCQFRDQVIAVLLISTISPNESEGDNDRVTMIG